MAKVNSPFSVDRAEDSLGFLFWQTTVTWQRLIKKELDSFNISHAQFVILANTLWFESHNQEVTQGLIIRQSKLDKMTVSKALKSLVANGYIKRFEHKEDTRAKAVFLTKKGKELASKLVPLVERIDHEYFGMVKKNERQALLAILNNLVSNIKE